jgi:hypothetical protein
MAKNVKKRHWGYVVYPDSAPNNWRDILQQSGLQCAISPLHDADVNADETEKKPHWHIIMCWSGPTTYGVAKAMADKLCAPIPQPLESVRGYYRYLTHKDNPEKVQYNERDIVCINGFNIADYIELTRTEITSIKRALVDFIRDENITEYSQLLEALIDSDMAVEFDIASNHTMFLNSYIRSRKYSVAEKEAGKKEAATARLRDEQDAKEQ